jgi:hypothetical protein
MCECEICGSGVVSTRVLRLSPINIIPPWLHTHISPKGWTIGPLVAAVQRHSLTPSTWTTSSLHLIDGDYTFLISALHASRSSHISSKDSDPGTHCVEQCCWLGPRAASYSVETPPSPGIEPQSSNSQPSHHSTLPGPPIFLLSVCTHSVPRKSEPICYNATAMFCVMTLVSRQFAHCSMLSWRVPC